MEGFINDFKEHFLLDSTVVYLNHGSYGACPRPVFDIYQGWQRELERQPVEFLARQAGELMAEARARLAQAFNCRADDLVYFTNPTMAINMVVRSLDLEPGDEILTTDHEYGAMERTWRFVSRKTGARYVIAPIPVPVTSPEELVEMYWAHVTPRTRAIFISHITSPTALQFPVTEICRRARGAGLISIVDGAHAPGQIDLDLAAVGADIYTGACHKWLCAPKGAAFLYVHPELQGRMDPLVVSWGYEAVKPGASQFIDYHEWQGTRDLAAFLSVPAALEYQEEHDWSNVRARCHQLACETRGRVLELTGLPSLSPESGGWFSQMFAAALPKLPVETLKSRLYQDFKIEVPVYLWNGKVLVRPSFQAYNDQRDADALIEALARLVPELVERA